MMYVPQAGTFFTRKALQAVGGWREQFGYTPDTDFLLRIALRFPVRKLDRLMARYRYHLLQRDRQRASICRDWEQMVRDLMANEPLDARTSRYARSGIFLARHRYADSSQWFIRTKALYSALLVNPAAASHPNFPKRELLPAREPIRKLLSKAKHALGFRPKGT